MDLKDLEKRINIQPQTEHDLDFIVFVEHLVKYDLIENEAAKGIAKKVVTDGVDFLSDKQKYVFLRHGILDNFTEHCKQCALPLPWSEMEYALEDDLCGLCRHNNQKY